MFFFLITGSVKEQSMILWWIKASKVWQPETGCTTFSKPHRFPVETLLPSHLNLKHFVLSRTKLYDYLEQRFYYDTHVHSSVLLTNAKSFTLAWVLSDGISGPLALCTGTQSWQGTFSATGKGVVWGSHWAPSARKIVLGHRVASATLLKKNNTTSHIGVHYSMWLQYSMI